MRRVLSLSVALTFAAVVLIGPAHAATGTPPTVTCTAQCEMCIEVENTGAGERCLKCGIDPNCGGAAAVDPGLSSDVTAIVNAHNAYRGQQCARPLTWSAELAAGAQAWANACTMQHSSEAWASERCCGENLYWGSPPLGDAEDAAKWWYDEVSKYDFANHKWRDDVGHFTQVVWKGSTHVGCGVAVCGGQNYWVCRYAPTGNWNVRDPNVLKANVGCARPALFQEGGGAKGSATVILAVDVYDGPDGNGTKIGVLEANTTVGLVEACRDNWCHVEGEAVPGGAGWVYSGPDYQSLRIGG